MAADVAQLVEHHLGKVEVTGSIPVISSTEKIYTGVAQLVEQRSPKPQAAGSNPAARANETKTIRIGDARWLSQSEDFLPT